MIKFSRWLLAGLLICSLLALIGGCGGQKQEAKPAAGSKPASKEDALAFYKGKTINFIVPYKTGGGYDRNARMITPYLQKYIPGATIVVRNVEGGGGLVGTNELYLSKPDGLTIGVLNTVGAVTNQAVGIPGVKYDLNKFTWIGRMNNEPKVVVVGANSPYRSLEDLKKAGKTLKFSVNGVGSSEWVSLEILKKISHLDMDIVAGYNTTAECDMSVLRGEVAGSSGSIGSKLPLIESKKMVPILLFGKNKDPNIPDVPLAPDIFTGNEKKMAEDYITLLELGRTVAAAPGTPPERTQVLREALEKSLKDPALLEEAKKTKVEIEPLGGDGTADLVKNSLTMPPELKELMTKSLGS